MKTFKSFVATAVAVIMILSSVLCVNIFADEYAQDTPVTFTDVTNDYTYYNAIYTLVKEGVIDGIAQEDGTYAFKPDNTITRAEFAKLIAVALVSDEKLLTQTTDKFPDVEQDHWANKYIAYAVSMGIIAGRDDGTFRPANPVTYGEAAKMLVCAKGYGEVYQATTPWYEGYVLLANQLGLTKGATGSGELEAPRGQVAQLIYNLRNVQYYQPKSTTPSIGGGGGRISKDVEEENEEETGIITAVYDSNLTGENLGLTTRQIMLDDTIYDIGDFELDNLYRFLGRRVDIEYSVKASGKKILERIEISSRNETITIKSADFCGIDEKVITYYPAGENKADTVTLSENLRVIYNGYSVPIADITDEFIEKYLNVESGQILLINNNGGKEYDVAQVSKYETFFVSSRTLANKTYTITDSYSGKSISLKEDDMTVYKISSVGGVRSEGKASDISANKVLSVAQPYDRTEGTTVIISEATIKNGEVDAISGEYVTIDGKEYTESPYYMALKASNPKDYKYEVGSKGQFYFDYSGRLTFYKKAENTDPYAYVMGFDDGKGLDGVCSIQLFPFSNSNPEATVFAFKDTVKVNGHNERPEDVGQILKNAAAVINKKSIDNEVKMVKGDYSQLIRYKSTTTIIDGESVPCITEIYTIDTDDLQEGTIVPGLFRTGKEGEKSAFTDGKTRLKYVSSSKSFQDEASSIQFSINSNTLVLLVPDDRSDAKEYKKKTSSYFANSTKYDIEPYDIKANVAGVVLVYTRGVSTKPTVTVTYNIALVDDVSPDENDKGKAVDKLSYFNAGDNIPEDPKQYKPKTMLTEKAGMLDGIDSGDLIRFAYENNEIVGVQKVFVDGQLYDWANTDVYDTFPAENGMIAHKNGNYEDYYQVVHGTVHSMNILEDGTGAFNVTPGIVENNADYTANWIPYEVTTSTKIYKWNSDTDRFDVIDASFFVTVESAKGDAVAASKVVAYKMSSNNTLKAIYLLG